MLGVSALLGGGSDSTWDERITSQARVRASATDLRGVVSRESVRRVVGDDVPVLQVRDLKVRDETLMVVYGTCDDLRRISGEEVADCASRPVWLEVPGRPAVEDASPKKPGGSADVDGTRMALPHVADTLIVGNLPTELDGALLISSGDGPANRSGDGSIFLMLPTGEDANRAIAAVGSTQRPPSLNESGVTLTTPMTSGTNVAVPGLRADCRR